MTIDCESDALPAAYQGKGWQPRQASLAQEISEGRFWSCYHSNAEYGFLKAVLLHIPDRHTPPVEDANSIQHLHPINYNTLCIQMLSLYDLYRRLGIEVFLISPSVGEGECETKHFHNLVFVRDLFFMTPEGAILSRMASEVRAGEELFAARALISLGIPIVRTVSGKGTFEGADALWVDAQTVLIGLGNRTNRSGFEQVKCCLEFQGVRALHVPLPSCVQHLLGVLQIVDKDLAVIRARILPSDFKAILESLGVRLVELDETVEVLSGQAMNFVTIAPRRIIMVSGNPDTRRILEENGIEVVAEAELSELLKGAGGLACATGVLHRQIPAIE
jgi:N-dimethylarginine dimethylaminohydrolase